MTTSLFMNCRKYFFFQNSIKKVEAEVIYTTDLIEINLLLNLT